ncbi:MAG: hypothetical protein MI923_21285 [Phycisphaerales bacterium]|nr:hypothetical protein [Phycisphaerales bacterium]
MPIVHCADEPPPRGKPLLAQIDRRSPSSSNLGGQVRAEASIDSPRPCVKVRNRLRCSGFDRLGYRR